MALSVKVKEKEIHGCDRPIGGFEKATQKKKRPGMIQRHLLLQWKQILVAHLVLRRQHKREKRPTISQRHHILLWKKIL